MTGDAGPRRAYDEVLTNVDDVADAVRMLWTADLGCGPEVVALLVDEVVRPLFARPNGSEQFVLQFLKVVRFLTVMAASGHDTTPREIVQQIALIDLWQREFPDDADDIADDEK